MKSKSESKFMKFMKKYLEYYDSIYWEEMDLNLAYQKIYDFDSFKLFKLIMELENATTNK